jgi:hypothetical protein
VIFAITSEVLSPIKREVVLKKDFGEKNKSTEKLKFESSAPNGKYLLNLSLNVDPIGCPLDVSVNGVQVLNHAKPWAKTTIQIPVTINNGNLIVELTPGEIHHKSKTAEAEVQLSSLVLEKMPKNIAIHSEKTESTSKQKDLVYGWKLRGRRAALRNYRIKDFTRQHETYVPVDNMMEDDEVYMITGGVVKGEFIIDDVPPGKYKVTIFARNRRLDSRVTIQVEDQKHKDVILKASDSFPGKIVAHIEKPLVYTVDVKDGQFNLIIDMASKDRLNYRTWDIAGLKLEKID